MPQRSFALGDTPVQRPCGTAAPRSLKPGLCISGSPRSRNLIGIGPRHVIMLLLNEPECTIQSQRQFCAGRMPAAGVQTIPDLAGVVYSDT